MKIVLYSTHCPKCNVLERKLEDKLIQFEMNTDIELMREKGFVSAPMLEVDGEIMNYADAIAWVNEQEV